MDLGIAEILKILPHRYPFLLVDRILEVEPGKRVVGIKNVTFNEEFFQGHFPGNPVMPGVLDPRGDGAGRRRSGSSDIDARTTRRSSCTSRPWTAASSAGRSSRATSCGSRPRSSQLKSRVCKCRAVATVRRAICAEAELLSCWWTARERRRSIRSAIVSPAAAALASGVEIGPVRGHRRRTSSSATERPSERTRRSRAGGARRGQPGLRARGPRLRAAGPEVPGRDDRAWSSGNRNVFREFSTIHRGTAAGHGETVIGDDNYFMAYSHVAHDCRIGSQQHPRPTARPRRARRGRRPGRRRRLRRRAPVHPDRRTMRSSAPTRRCARTSCRSARPTGIDDEDVRDQPHRPASATGFSDERLKAPRESVPAARQVKLNTQPGPRTDRGGASAGSLTWSTWSGSSSRASGASTE